MEVEYIYKEAFIKALDELKRVGIIKKNMAIFNTLIETYKEPYTQWKNECIKHLKIEEVLRKKMLILSEK